MGTRLQPFQPIAAITTTPAGIHTLQPLWEAGAATLWIPETIASSIQNSQSKIQKIEPYSGSLKAHLAALWPDQRSFVFCLATGAVVRLIAPLLQDKAIDPAVVVIDPTGKFVISLCGGHQGGADLLTRTIAHYLGATPVLTGSANELALPGIDVLGIPFGWHRGTGDWTGVSAAVARQQPVQVIQEAGSTLWQTHLPAGHPFVFEEEEAEGRRQTADGRRQDNTEDSSPSPHPPIYPGPHLDQSHSAPLFS